MAEFWASIGDIGDFGNRRTIPQFGFGDTSNGKFFFLILTDNNLGSSAAQAGFSGSFAFCLIYLPTPVLDILLNFCQQGVQAFILNWTLIEVMPAGAVQVVIPGVSKVVEVLCPLIWKGIKANKKALSIS